MNGEFLLQDQFLDHVFGDLERDQDGWARFHVRGTSERLTVAFGPTYSTAVVYAPTGDGQSFICFEPMSGITNAFNLSHRGTYADLPEIPPGGIVARLLSDRAGGVLGLPASRQPHGGSGRRSRCLVAAGTNGR